MNPSLGRIRQRLTLWYVGVFALILVVLGAALLVVLTRQMTLRMDHSLEMAAAEVARAAEIRELESALPPGMVVDAFDEVRIPGRQLYVFDVAGHLVHPDEAPDWLNPSVSGALATGEHWARHEADDGITYRIYANRFTLPDGKLWVAVAIADVLEVHEEFAALIFVFGFAGLASLVLVALGGAALARRSTAPVEHAFAQMHRFMADAAHELRTPLTVLRGRAEVALQRARTPEKYGEALSGIVTETTRMGSMVEKMLLLSQADSGSLPLRRERVFLDDLLVEAAEDARVVAAGRNVNVEISDLIESPIQADSHLVRQMLLTILDNAVRYTPDGGRVLASVSCSGATATVNIADVGPGMPPSVLSQVFEPFYRGDSARERTGGAGLGLTIARSIAMAHGATIDIDSAVGAGTRVTLTFPSDGTHLDS